MAIKLANDALGLQSAATLEEAKLGLDVAKAQLAIREAEANEVAVKLKHAKRRADDAAKAETAEERTLRFARTEAEAVLSLTQAQLKLAEQEHARTLDLVTRGVVAQTEVTAAKLKVEKAQLDVKTREEAVRRLNAAPPPPKP